MRKIVMLLMTLAALCGVLAGCGGEKKAEKGKIPELKVMVSPYRDADTIQTATQPLADLLKSRLKEKGYDVGKVSIHVGTSYSGVGEALSAGSADVGFISGATYILYDKDVDVLLTALREGINKETTDLKVWNDGQPEKFTKELVPYYRSVFVVGSSAKGKALLKKVEAGQQPTWEELDALNWAVMNPASASGYLYPSLYLKKHYGKKISDLSHVVQADSYSTSMARLASGQADIAVAFGHIRIRMDKNWQSKFGGTGSIWQQTGIVAVTDKIYNDTVSVSKTSKVMQDKDFRKALGESLIEIGKTPEGLKALGTLGHKGYTWATAKDYDDERAVQKELK